MASACGSSSGSSTDAADSAEAVDPCEVLSESALGSLDEGIPLTLQGAERVSVEPDGDLCVVRYEGGADWVELAFAPEGFVDTSGFFPLGDIVTTDGATMSTVRTDQGVITVIASASDPSRISTWDASLSGTSALSR